MATELRHKLDTLKRAVEQENISTTKSLTQKLLDPLLGQKGRGWIASLISSLIAFIPSYILQKAGTDSTANFLLIDLVLGNFIGFVLDIMIGTKEGFCKNQLFTNLGWNNQCKGKRLCKSNIFTKLGLKSSCTHTYIPSKGGFQGATGVLADKMVSQSYFAFWVTVIFDIIISVKLFDGITLWLDQNEIWHENEVDENGQETNTPTTLKIIRNFIVRLLISSTTFYIYANRFRFDWAYKKLNSTTRFPDIFVIGLLLVVITDYYFNTPEDGHSFFREATGKSLLVNTSFFVTVVYLIMVYGIIKPFGTPSFLKSKKNISIIAVIITLGFVIGPIASVLSIPKDENPQ